jgi:hypothetical protein
MVNFGYTRVCITLILSFSYNGYVISVFAGSTNLKKKWPKGHDSYHSETLTESHRF